MRIYALALAVVALGAAQAPAGHAKARVGTEFDARVVLIADGDTLELIPAGETRPIRIRLEGVDAPEFGEAFSREATTLTRTLLLQQRVRVEGRDVDRYGRLVARVSASGRDTSLALVQAGLACHFTQFANDRVLADAQSRARAAGAGFWAANARKPRCTGLARTAPAAPAHRTAPGAPGAPAHRTAPVAPIAPDAPVAPSYRGNSNSRLYHASSCPNASCRNCTRLFASEAEAKMAGFKPAGDCLKVPKFQGSKVPGFERASEPGTLELWNPGTLEPWNLGTLIRPL